ncbi:MAG: replicative DNA helicase [Deltaproteobacteria bacterium RBG_19FT_COMBO_52_11]|nr:MAG: replicative DNA helicase [Deltaproteobacteria bacterium RBG_19FT_COMBO_52_11]
MDFLAQRLPPQSLEAEVSVLGGILLENEAFNRVLEVLGEEDFYRESHRKIFSALIQLYEHNEPADLITLSEVLKKRNALEDVGGVEYLNSLVNSVPTAANISYYAKIIKEKSILRKVINRATEIISLGYEGSGDVDDFLDQAERSIFEISEDRVRPSFYPIKDIIKASFRTIEKLYEKRQLITGVPTGFAKLDELTSGLQPADLIIVAGRPSMGKTALALNITQHAAIEGGIPSAIFSLEMAKEQLALRMLCSEAKVDAHRLRGGFLSDSDWPRLTRAAGSLSEAPIFIDDTPSLSALEMRAKSRRLKAEHHLGLVVVDYLQLMRGRADSERREQEISDISRSLKALAKELNIPVIALSQLNRRVEDRGDRRPQLADLRESGAIEQDADVIIFLYRDEVYNKSEDNPHKGKAEIIIGKQRNGPTDKFELAFLDKYTCFENLSPIQEAS